MDNPNASRRLADKLREAADALGDIAIGRPGRVTGTYEKSVPRLPYIIVYAIESRIEGEMIVILRVIHTARDWPQGGWPQ
jgi:plasmid stabilization system protein ParE